MLAANVRREERGADGPPRDITACQKIVGRRALLARVVVANGEDHEKVQDQHHVVDGNEPDRSALKQQR
jgi:hypothetical protein